MTASKGALTVILLIDIYRYIIYDILPSESELFGSKVEIQSKNRAWSLKNNISFKVCQNNYLSICRKLLREEDTINKQVI